jgi:hypothetical protein
MPADPRELTTPDTKEHYLAWAHQTIRYCFFAFGQAKSRGGPAAAPTEALAIAHDFWESAVEESGSTIASEVAPVFIAMVLEWCAAYRTR